MEHKAVANEKVQVSLKVELAKDRLNLKRFVAPRASGPSDWKKFSAKHREILTIPADPPVDGTDVTQNGKRRQRESASSI